MKKDPALIFENVQKSFPSTRPFPGPLVPCFFRKPAFSDG
jgi:hypothetical protein